MIERLTKGLAWAKRLEDERGGALVEAAFCLPVLMILTFALIDFSQIILDNHVMTGISRQGSDLASRAAAVQGTGTELQDIVSALVLQGASLNIGTQGRIIVTEVHSDTPNTPLIKDQAISLTGISVTSAVGTGIGSAANMPTGATTVLNAGQTLYVTEVFYSYKPMTPVGGFLKTSLAGTLYQAAYF